MQQCTGTFLVRYADDFIVLGDNPELLQRALQLIKAFLKLRGLSINLEKTRTTTIEQGFDFVAYNFRQYVDKARAKGNKKGILLVKPCRKNVINIKQKLTQTTYLHRNSSAGKLITALNPILRGWAEHFRTTSSRAAFRTVSEHTFKLLKKWVYKKHKIKGRRQGLNKYFKTVITGKSINRWVFHGHNERKEPIGLYQIGYTTKKPYKMISLKDPKNPFLLEHNPYFKQRTKTNLANSELLDKRKKSLIRKQDGKCTHCDISFQMDSLIELHHIVPYKQGGDNKLSNLRAVHQHCHKQITHGPKKTAG